ncbi:MAG: XRE family transcriptional regulator [Planctomycetota bacterium]|jgi:transcriptional regulator with XRE-family HTH domain
MRRTSDALEILHRRIGNDPERLQAIEEGLVKGDIASLIHDARHEAGLTQKQLADKIGTKQSVIARLEDTDYDGHSLSMLCRVAYALHYKVQITLTPHENRYRAIAEKSAKPTRKRPKKQRS